MTSRNSSGDFCLSAKEREEPIALPSAFFPLLLYSLMINVLTTVTEISESWIDHIYLKVRPYHIAAVSVVMETAVTDHYFNVIEIYFLQYMTIHQTLMQKLMLLTIVNLVSG